VFDSNLCRAAPEIPPELDGLPEEHFGVLYAYQLVVHGLTLVQHHAAGISEWLARRAAWDMHLLAMELASSLAEGRVGAMDESVFEHARNCAAANPLASKCVQLAAQATKNQARKKKRKKGKPKLQHGNP
jgi:hypothetical protein